MTAEEIEDLIERSSLGSADARILRAQATPEVLDEVRRRRTDYSLTQANEIRNSIEESADRYRVAETADRLLGDVNVTAKELCKDLVSPGRRPAPGNDPGVTAELSERRALYGHLAVVLNAAFREPDVDRVSQTGSGYLDEYLSTPWTEADDCSARGWLHSVQSDDELAELDNLTLAFFSRLRAAGRNAGPLFHAWPGERSPIPPEEGSQRTWSATLNDVDCSAIRRDDVLVFTARRRASVDSSSRRDADDKVIRRRIALLEVAFDLHGAILAASSVSGVPTGVVARTAALAGAALENVKAACERRDYFMSPVFVEGTAGWTAVDQLSRTAAAADLLRQELARILKDLRSSLLDSIHEAAAWCRSLSVEGKSSLMSSAATLFFGLDLGGARLSHTDFSNINLIGVNFAKADLTEAMFSGSDLTGANLDGACIAGAIWSVTTVWPDGYSGHVKARSTELEAGVFRVSDNGEHAPRDAVLAS